MERRKGKENTDTANLVKEKLVCAVLAESVTVYLLSGNS